MTKRSNNNNNSQQSHVLIVPFSILFKIKNHYKYSPANRMSTYLYFWYVIICFYCSSCHSLTSPMFKNHHVCVCVCGYSISVTIFSFSAFIWYLWILSDSFSSLLVYTWTYGCCLYSVFERGKTARIGFEQ